MIAGELRMPGGAYYLCVKETSKLAAYYLVSKVKLKDFAEYQLTGKTDSIVINDVSLLEKYFTTEYLVEALTKSKVTGVVKKYGTTSQIEQVLDTIHFARSYKFDNEDISINKREMVDGIESIKFSASNSRVTLDYTETDGIVEEMIIAAQSISLSLYPLEKPLKGLGAIKLSEVSVRESKAVLKATIRTITFDILAQSLDMSWYKDLDGTVKKNYQSVKNVYEFESKVMTPLIKAILRNHANGEVTDVGCDTETTGLNIYNLSKGNPDKDHCVSLQLSWEDNQGVVMFFDMEYFTNVDMVYCCDRLQQVFEKYKDARTIEYYEFDDGQASSQGLVEMASFGEVTDIHSQPDLANVRKLNAVIYRDWVSLDGHNCGFDRKTIFDCGYDFWFDDDTLQMAFNLNPKTVRNNNKLKALTRRLFGHETPELSDVLGKGNEDKYRYLVDEEVACIYGCADTDYARQLKKYLRKLTPGNLYKRYKQQDVPLINLLPISEYYGLQTYEDDLIRLAHETKADVDLLKESVYAYVGAYMDYAQQVKALTVANEMGRFSSTAEFKRALLAIKPDPHATYRFEFKASELRNVLYNLLKYPIFAYTEGNARLPKVDKYVLKKLIGVGRKPDSRARKLEHDIIHTGVDQAEYERMKNGTGAEKKQAERWCLVSADKFNELEYPVALILQKFSELNKEYTSYYKPILEQNMEGKIFKSYSMARIETRRISNPIQTTKGSLKALIRSYSEDYYTLDFDMAQVEYRIMISLAKFSQMIEKMKDPEKDFHRETASLMHNKPAYKVTKYERKGAKTVSFGIPYGLGERSLCEKLFDKITEQNLFKTRMLLINWMEKNKPIVDLLEASRAEALTPVDLSPELRDFMQAYVRDQDTKEFIRDAFGNKVPLPLGEVHNAFGFYRTFDLSNIGQSLSDKARRYAGQYNGPEGCIRRPAGNYVVQSFAAELFRIILIRFYNLCEQEGIHFGKECIWHMLIHDELLCSVHKSIHPMRIYKLVKKACMITMPGHTNYFVGINIGDNWAECKNDDHEAPVIFVDRMVQKWDNGDFALDKTDPKYLKNGDPSQGYWFDHPYEFIEPMMTQYKFERIREALLKIDPEIDSDEINVPSILERFDNYTVRGYLRELPQLLKVDKKDYVVCKDDKGKDVIDDDRYGNACDEQCLLTWVTRQYPDGRSVRLYDGNCVNSLDALALAEEQRASITAAPKVTLEIDPEELFADDALEQTEQEEFYSFDEDDISYTVLLEDEIMADEDRVENGIVVDYSKAKEAKSFAGMLAVSKPYESIQAVNNSIVIKTCRQDVASLKSALRKYVQVDAGNGRSIVFDVNGVIQRWLYVNNAYDLGVLDSVVTSTVKALQCNRSLRSSSLEVHSNNIQVRVRNFAQKRNVLNAMRTFGVQKLKESENRDAFYSVILVDAFGASSRIGYLPHTADLAALNTLITEHIQMK